MEPDRFILNQYCEENNLPYLSDYDNYVYRFEQNKSLSKIDNLKAIPIGKLLKRAVINNDLRIVLNYVDTDIYLPTLLDNCISEAGIEIATTILYHRNHGKYIDEDETYPSKREDTVLYLLSKGFKLSSFEQDISTSDKIFIENDMYNIVKYLINKRKNKEYKFYSSYLVPKSIRMTDLLIENNYMFSIDRIIEYGKIEIVEHLINKGIIKLLKEHLDLSVKNMHGLFYYILSRGIKPDKITLYQAVDYDNKIMEKMVRNRGTKFTSNYIAELINWSPDIGIRYIKEVEITPNIIEALIKRGEIGKIVELIDKDNFKMIYDIIMKSKYDYSGRAKNMINGIVLDQV